MSMEHLVELISNPDLLPQRARHYGVYYGIVEDIHDPALLGRIRVRAPHYVGLPVDALPWAAYSSPGGGGFSGIGIYFLPVVGSSVLVTFLGGDPQYPVWLGAVPGAPDDVPDTYVSSMDPASPYGQTLVSWDYTKVTTITTQSGHKIILDDNFSGAQDAKRILIETSRGHFFRMIESKNADAFSEHNALIELATVRDDDDKSAIRRIALDNDLENITITGPDTADSGTHEIEISSPEDYIRAKTNRGYTMLLDDKNQKIKLFTTRPGTDEEGFRLEFDNPAKRFEIRSIEDRFGITCLDNDSGYLAMIAPYTKSNGQRKAAIVIDRSAYGAFGGDPFILISAGEESAGSNGILVDPGFAVGGESRPQGITIYGQGTTSGPYPQGYTDVIQIISKDKGSSSPAGQITIGKLDGSHTIRLIPTSDKIEIKTTGELDIRFATNYKLTGELSSTIEEKAGTVKIESINNNMTLKSQVITMEGPIVHNYFRHYHEIDLAHVNNLGKMWAVLVPNVTSLPIVCNSGSGNPISDPTMALKTNPPNAVSPYLFPLGT